MLQKGTTALITAACQGNNEVVNLLVGAGADLNLQDELMY